MSSWRYRAATVEVLSAGTQTSVQDYPGRLGYWAVGVPPSGPMDDRALRLGNRLLGNAEGAAALEITLNGPTLKFNTDVQAVVCGAPLAVTLDGVDQPLDCVLTIPAGATLKLGAISGAGVRSYLCLSGGIQVPDYLGSKSTFTLGQFGGHGGRRCAEATCCIWRRTPPPEAGINCPPRYAQRWRRCGRCG